MILAAAARFFFLVIVIRLKHFLMSAQVFLLPHYVYSSCYCILFDSPSQPNSP